MNHPETIKVVAEVTEDNPAGFTVINKEDFVEGEHEEFVETEEVEEENEEEVDGKKIKVKKTVRRAKSRK